MPKIAAENIESHIRQQTSRILKAANELFTEKGYRDTDLAGIAKKTGLARNSLYRYFPSKDHILVAVMREELAPYLERTERLGSEISDPHARIEAWLDLQMDLATGPCHAMIRILGDMGETTEELKQEIRAMHDAPRAVLEAAVTEVLDGSGRNPRVVSSMLVSMLQAAAGIAMWTGDTDSVMAELRASVRGVLAPGEKS